MIPKVTLLNLYKDVFRRSTLIAIPQLSDLLEVPGSNFTKWEVFYGIVKEALKTFDYYFPLTLIQKIYIVIDSNSRMGEITGNFDAYLEGNVPEDQIVLVPSAIVGMSTSMYTNSTIPLRMFRYNPPKLTDFWYSTNIFWVNSICNHPLIEEYDKVTKEPTDKCAVYYLNENVDSEYSIFRDQLYLEVCKYIFTIKKNMGLPNMPIELFQGLEEDASKVEQNLTTIYQQGLNNSYWLI